MWLLHHGAMVCTGWILLLKEVVPEEIDYKATPLIIRSSFTGEHPHS
jgi:hypothetical protein